MLVVGFVGTLRNMWDNYLTDLNRADILDSIANKSVVKIGGPTSTSIEAVEDTTTTLVYSIDKHFVGEPHLFLDRSLQILNNLYCKKLTDFRLYKDMFITKVMIREDFNNDYWKQRFLSGLPPHFSEKVRSKIRDRCEGKIPYSHISYGDPICLINFVAMELCTDLKLMEQLKKDQKFLVSENGIFYKYFGFQIHKPPSARKVSKKERSGKSPDCKKSPRRKKHLKKRSKHTSQKDKCWTC